MLCLGASLIILHTVHRTSHCSAQELEHITCLPGVSFIKQGGRILSEPQVEVQTLYKEKKKVSTGTASFRESRIQRSPKPGRSRCCSGAGRPSQGSCQQCRWNLRRGKWAIWWVMDLLFHGLQEQGIQAQTPHLDPTSSFLPLLRAILTLERPFEGGLILPSPPQNLRLGR